MSLVFAAMRPWRPGFITMVSDRGAWPIVDGSFSRENGHPLDYPKITVLNTAPALLYGWAGTYQRNYTELVSESWARGRSFASVEDAADSLWSFLSAVHKQDFGVLGDPSFDPSLHGLGVVVGGFDGGRPEIFRYDYIFARRWSSREGETFFTPGCLFERYWFKNRALATGMVQAACLAPSPELSLQALENLMALNEAYGRENNVIHCMPPYDSLSITSQEEDVYLVQRST